MNGVCKLKKLLELGVRDQLLLVRAWLSLLLVSIMFRYLPKEVASRFWFKREDAITASQFKNRLQDIEKQAEISRVVRLFQIAVSHHIVEITCLYRVIILKRLLAKCHIESSIIIGTRKEGERLAAHAWIEVEEEVIADSRDYTNQFVPLKSQQLSNSTLLTLSGDDQ